MKPPSTTAAALAVLLIATLTVPAAAAPYRNGEYVTIEGRVTDFDGSPLAGVTVLLEPSRRVFRLSKMFKRKRNREQTDRLQIPTVSGADGSYRFQWRWDSYYDTFELAIAVEAASGAQKTYEILHRTDFTDRMKNGSPVVVALEIEDPSRLQAAPRRGSPAVAETPPPRSGGSGETAAAGGSATADERRIRAEMGDPDQIDSHERLAGTETSWWYFEDGKVYHFMNGELSQVMHFDPIPSAPNG